MADSGEVKKGFYRWLANYLERRSWWIILGTIVITLLLIVPLMLMQPTEIASDNPTVSDVVQWNEEIQDTFPSEVCVMAFMVEARDNDILTRENLYELYQNEEELRSGDLSPFLYSPLQLCFVVGNR